MLLAIDTSTSAVTAAVHDGTDVIASTSTIDARRHTEILAPAIEKVLADAGIKVADLTKIVTGVGPGPFTGLRVGIMTAMTLGFALDVPVAGICSLDALAFRAQADGMRGSLLVATDARRKEVYWACYELSDDIVSAGEPAVEKAQAVAELVGDIPAVGRGAALYAEHLNDAIDGREALLDVDAADVARLAQTRLAAGIELLGTEPLYLRRPDAVPAAAKPNSRVLATPRTQ